MNVFFFGDSICHGQFISPHKTWISHISAEIAKTYPDVLILNPSHSGDTTRMALEKMPFDVQQHGIDIIFIQFGINDSNLWITDNGLPRVSKAGFEANLREMIERANRFGAKKVILNTNHPINKMVQLQGKKKIQLQDETTKYNNITRSVAKSIKGVDLIDMEKEFYSKIKGGKTVDYFLLEDGVHINDKGHALYYETVFPVLKQYIKQVKK